MTEKKWNQNAPAYLHWSFGDRAFSHPLQAASSAFQARFLPCLSNRPTSFAKEFERALERLDAARSGRPVALAFSGGLKSELLARGLSQIGVPYELYFFDFWGLNPSSLREAALPLAKSLGKELRVLRAERVPFYKHAKKLFLTFGCESPAPLLMAHLFEQIPAGEFLLMGDGGPDRIGELYRHIGERNPIPTPEKGIYLPFSTSNLFFYWWATEKQRAGEFYFYSSTPELMGAAISDPRLEYSYPFCDTRKVLHAAFPQIPQQNRLTNWESATAMSENLEIRKALWRLAVQSDGFEHWQRLLGTCVRATELFI